LKLNFLETPQIQTKALQLLCELAGRLPNQVLRRGRANR
jgi:hypothetical protein